MAAVAVIPSSVVVGLASQVASRPVGSFGLVAALACLPAGDANLVMMRFPEEVCRLSRQRNFTGAGCCCDCSDLAAICLRRSSGLRPATAASPYTQA
jgi:hypothetical protein